jgi:2-keto-3-deoxy-L-rhamnonate aldolase RhmA
MPAYPSTIRQKIAKGDVVLGTAMFTPEAHVASAIYNGCGVDWVWIDHEHDPFGTESVGTIAVMGRQAGVAPVIRVAWNDPGLIKKAYDVGAVGVMVPQVDNAEEARQAIRYAKYPPLGERGIAPWFAGLLGVSGDDVIKHANSETVLILQLESAEAYEKVDETLKLEDFEVLLFGPTDMSASLGVPGKIHHPKVENVMLDVARKAKRAGKMLGCTFGDPEDCRRWIGEGYRFMNISSPLELGINGVKKYAAEFREQFGKK